VWRLKKIRNVTLERSIKAVRTRWRHKFCFIQRITKSLKRFFTKKSHSLKNCKRRERGRNMTWNLTTTYTPHTHIHTQLIHTSKLRISSKNVIRTSLSRIVDTRRQYCMHVRTPGYSSLPDWMRIKVHCFTHCQHQGLHYNWYDKHVISPRKADPPSHRSFSGLLLYVHTIDMPELHCLVCQPAFQQTDMTMTELMHWRLSAFCISLQSHQNLTKKMVVVGIIK
jgi:hypothetical protein